MLSAVSLMKFASIRSRANTPFNTKSDIKISANLSGSFYQNETKEKKKAVAMNEEQIDLFFD